ncbi:ABC transporter permease subunit [Marinoscillum sp. 108]|uniref:ABC transporter permease subunit n=1 Tax=Marinoscillum sp. 108 TaxID=2653151 RepID=UPI0012F1F56C|nr:ABC transporter permease subunit [Marinoscillum sp. 108]VXD18297.1 ABC transporter permease [Marinoscillum sp. 108]
MIKILKYSFSDLTRSRWSFIYLAFYLLLGSVLLFLNNDLSKGIITLMNVIVVLTPMIGTIFGVMYFYNSREFTELLLAQPVKRSVIFLGQYLGISISLSLSLVLGLGLPFLAYGLFRSGEIANFILLITSGTLLTFIFVALSICIALFNSNKIKGFGYAILMWLFFAVIYDGLVLLSMMVFAEYPLDNFALIASFLNPIDLSRIMILLKLDISALLGYTGALFQRFFGTSLGLIASWCMLLIWTIVPTVLLIRKAQRKNF